MKKIFRPASILFSILCLCVFFIVGLYFAGWVNAGKDQGLAGGAIIFGWGVLFAGIALVGSFFITRTVTHKKIITGNLVLLILLLLGFGLTYYRLSQRDALQEDKSYGETTTPVSPEN